MRNETKVEYPQSRQKGKRVFNWRTRRNGEITASSNQGYASKSKARAAFIAFLGSLASLTRV